MGLGRSGHPRLSKRLELFFRFEVLCESGALLLRELERQKAQLIGRPVQTARLQRVNESSGGAGRSGVCVGRFQCGFRGKKLGCRSEVAKEGNVESERAAASH